MIRFQSYEQLLETIYNGRWDSFSTSKQVDILKCLQFVNENDGIKIERPTILPSDIAEAVDLAMRELDGLTLAEVMNGKRYRELFDLRCMASHLMQEKTGISPVSMLSVYNYPGNRTSIIHSLKVFDDLFTVDPLYKEKYKRLLCTVDRYIRDKFNS